MTNYSTQINHFLINGREAFAERRKLFLESLERRTSSITINSAAGFVLSAIVFYLYIAYIAYTGSVLVYLCTCELVNLWIL